MKAIQLLTLIALSTILVGCQIEVTPLDNAGLTSQATNITETDSKDTGGEMENGESNITASSVTLYWSAPVERANGANIATSEIGAYEIRYKKSSETSYTNVVISNTSVAQHVIDGLDDATLYEFEVAAIDTDGLYSNFVLASPHSL
ncbi:fibronectin type III domain-containing protein [Reinekea sp. G2M2-21]|uniref:fibronectin type III domain-containing protein n=1 Tax=Reinekea sp. G2M2-21 TaxID=2788942 RepID=UPI0018AA65F1|nr:fibronectin type III domain-containing protein [Reinekea sp. G2M2-21]